MAERSETPLDGNVERGCRKAEPLPAWYTTVLCFPWQLRLHAGTSMVRLRLPPPHGGSLLRLATCGYLVHCQGLSSMPAAKTLGLLHLSAEQDRLRASDVTPPSLRFTGMVSLTLRVRMLPRWTRRHATPMSARVSLGVVQLPLSDWRPARGRCPFL